MYGLGTYLFVTFLIVVVYSLLEAARTALKEANMSKLQADMENDERKATFFPLECLKNTEERRSALACAMLLLFAFGVWISKIYFAASLSARFEQHLNQTAAGLIIICLLWLFICVFGVAATRQIVRKCPEATLYRLHGLTVIVSTLFLPVAYCGRLVAKLALMPFHIDSVSEEAVSEEDIVMMLDAGAEDGTLNNDDIEYIKNVFELDHLTAADVMTPRNSIELLPADANEAEITALIEESGYSRIPVYSGTVDNITGILLVRDYLLKRHGQGFNLNDILLQPVFVPETVHLDKLFKDMQTDHSHIVIVVDEYGGTAGLVTMEDILEELVGEIWDEQDEETVNFHKQADGSYNVLSATPIDEFFEFFSLPEDESVESTTVNGWVTEQCGKIPEQGFSFNYKNLTITVIKADDLHSEEINVIVNAPEAENE